MAAVDSIFFQLGLPKPGDHELRILTPTLVELVRVNQKQPDPARVDSWDWVNDQGIFSPPDLSSIKVIVNGQTNNVTGVGFKRRPIYGPLDTWDLRIANHLYLQLSNPISDGQSVQVINNGTLWPQNMSFAAAANPLRYSPAIHVNQEGYVPSSIKKAIVGYYLGNLGELLVPTNRFLIVSAQSGATVFEGTMTARADVGFTYTPLPYQNVREADFSSFTTPGEYRLVVPRMGASVPFRIDEGSWMNFARTYALGVLHQRSGFHVALPFTRFGHGADHLAPASMPTNDSPTYAFTWRTISNYASFVNSDNPPQIAPRLTSPSAQLYPYLNAGPVEVAGGHFEAGNYSKVAWNSAQLIHVLVFAADSLTGVGALDNLGLPESGDGISDLLQEAKWEADSLAKMQDIDGGFYFMVHPLNREYEFNVLPENGDPQVVWPKNTGCTAAAVAALAQCASSPRFKQAFPQTATSYLAKALTGWRFLTNAAARYGQEGAYQRVMHFGDDFTDKDDLAWAACELFLATGDPQFHAKLQSIFPDPTDASTSRWGWFRLFASYGNAVRSYAFGARSGRVQFGQLDANYFGKCTNSIVWCGYDNLDWSVEGAYGSSFPELNKVYRSATWHYSTERAFDLAVAYEILPWSAFMEAVIWNLNYEAGCNPVNVSFLTGLGWKRQRILIDLYSAIDGRTLPKTGIPISNIQEGIPWTFIYGGQPNALCYPSDHTATAPYAFYDRWSDFWNVSTEASTANTVRSLAVTAWLAAQTSLASQPWRSTNATIVVPPGTSALGQPVTVTLQVADPNLSSARIVWEARNQEPSFGSANYTFTPVQQEGLHWVEAEVQWPDGRRAFASNSVMVSASSPNARPQLINPQKLVGGGFSFVLTGVPQTAYIVEGSTNLLSWTRLSTNTLPANGRLEINDAQAPSLSRRYYRAMKVP